MRVGSANGWIFTPPDTSSRPDNYLMKVFFRSDFSAAIAITFIPLMRHCILNAK
jgi:hypothetical protein